MQVSLPNEVVNAALPIATSRGYKTVADYVVALVRRENEIESLKPIDQQNSDARRIRLREWAASQPATTHFVDTSRESIYGDRGL